MSDGTQRAGGGAPLVVIGAGLIGPVLALYLARRGYRVQIYDRRPDPRAAYRSRGRSINLTLCERGFRALERVGAAEPLRRLGTPATGRMLHQADGATEFQPYGNQGEAIYSVVRREIHEELLSLAEAEPGVELFFEHEGMELDFGDALDPSKGAPVVTFQHRGRRVRVEADRLFGCDGAFSAVRSRMQRLDRFDYSQVYAPQAYKELHAPASADGSHPLDPNALHIWPRGRHMLIGFANQDHTFTLALHLPFEGEVSFETIVTDDDLVALFERDFPDALPLLPNLLDNFHEHPVTSMITTRCRPWSVGDRVLLVGDSAHAIVPSYGQGANSGFEDCSIFADSLDASPGDWGTIFRDYEQRRKADADAIADLSQAHFDELQVQVSNPAFLRRKAIERRVQALFPDLFQSLYTMVSFTTMPYREAYDRAAEQAGILDLVVADNADDRGVEATKIEAADIEEGALDTVIRRAVSQHLARSVPSDVEGGAAAAVGDAGAVLRSADDPAVSP